MLHVPDRHAALKRIYGYHGFRGVQEAAIESICAGRNVFVLMATGGGKSICYIVSGVVLGRMVVVVSPLISLMQDQVHHLHLRHLSACYLGSAQEDPTVWSRVELGAVQFVYVTPEMMATARFQALMRQCAPAFVAIDEAHCVTEWGHDFRPPYRQIASLVDKAIPLMALTATATETVRHDIVHTLGMHDCVKLVTSVDRPNLTYTILSKGGRACDEEVARALRGAAGSAIVYMQTKRDVDQLHAALRGKHGVDVRAYHGDMDAETRQSVHADFACDRVRVVVATVAFGMGIDKPDIRTVLHWGVPTTVESYYQQAGRAGRDGEPARCVMWVGAQDWVKASYIAGDSEHIDLGVMRRFVESHTCRRELLLRHFSQWTGQTLECACDNCAAQVGPAVDVTEDARLLLRAVGDCGARYGEKTILSVLVGRVAAKHKRLKNAASHGTGAHRATDHWSTVLIQCCDAGLAERRRVAVPQGIGFFTVDVTAEGRRWLALERTLECTPRSVAQASASDACSGDALFEELRALVKRHAGAQPLHTLIGMSALREVAHRKPTTIAELLDVSVVTLETSNRCGNDIIALVRSHA